VKYIAYGFALLAIALVSVGVFTAIGSSSAAAVSMASGRHGTAIEPSLSSIGNVFVNLAVVAVITAIVAPIKQRLERKRQAGVPARRQPAQPGVTPSI